MAAFTSSNHSSGTPVTKQVFLMYAGKEGGVSRRWPFGCHVHRNSYFLDYLPYLHKLGGPRCGVSLQLPPFCPPVSIVVMVHIAEGSPFIRLVDDDAYILANPCRPEVGVLGTSEPVHAEAGVGLDSFVGQRPWSWRPFGGRWAAWPGLR